jgi:hypothetical protein
MLFIVDWHDLEGIMLGVLIAADMKDGTMSARSQVALDMEFANAHYAAAFDR